MKPFIDLEDTKFTIENAEILYNNIEGRRDRYDPAGRRSLCVALPKDYDGTTLKLLGLPIYDKIIDGVRKRYVKLRVILDGPTEIRIPYEDGFMPSVRTEELFDCILPFLSWDNVNIVFQPISHITSANGMIYSCVLRMIEIRPKDASCRNKIIDILKGGI